MNVRYVVHDENALCYVDPARNDLLMGVLAGDIFRGGPDPKNGPIAKTGRVRDATLEDFNRFRVMPPPTIHPLDLGSCVIGMVEQPDGSIRIVP